MKPRKTPPTRGLVAVVWHGLLCFFILSEKMVKGLTGIWVSLVNPLRRSSRGEPVAGSLRMACCNPKTMQRYGCVNVWPEDIMPTELVLKNWVVDENVRVINEIMNWNGANLALQKIRDPHWRMKRSLFTLRVADGVSSILANLAYRHAKLRGVRVKLKRHAEIDREHVPDSAPSMPTCDTDGQNDGLVLRMDHVVTQSDVCVETQQLRNDVCVSCVLPTIPSGIGTTRTVMERGNGVEMIQLRGDSLTESAANVHGLFLHNV